MSMGFDTPKTHIPIPEREVYIPAWGNEHTNPNLTVRQDGRSLGFTVGEMLPERRWAVGLDGELMNQRDFEDNLKRWRSYACTRAGTVVAMGAVNKHFDPGLEGYPQVADFVDRHLDAHGKLVPLTYLKRLAASQDPSDADVPIGFSRVKAEEDEPEVAQKPEPAKAVARCGREVAANRMKNHVRFCKKGCQA